VDLSPAEQLGDFMVEARAQGCEFFLAWVEATSSIDWTNVTRREREGWQAAFTDGAVIAGWHAAYEGFPDPRGEACAVLDRGVLEVLAARDRETEAELRRPPVVTHMATGSGDGTLPRGNFQHGRVERTPTW
jgi:hypothetical protein